MHGREQEVVLGGSRVLLFPIFHPAAALYTPRMLDVLQADFERLPELLGRGRCGRARSRRRARAPQPSRPPFSSASSRQSEPRSRSSSTRSR